MTTTNENIPVTTDAAAAALEDLVDSFEDDTTTPEVDLKSDMRAYEDAYTMLHDAKELIADDEVTEENLTSVMDRLRDKLVLEVDEQRVKELRSTWQMLDDVRTRLHSGMDIRAYDRIAAEYFDAVTDGSINDNPPLQNDFYSAVKQQRNDARARKILAVYLSNGRS